MLAKLRPDKALSDVLRVLKCNASGWMHDVFPSLRNFSWQRGYAAFTVSQSHVPKVQRYISKQKEHHQKVSFRDEFIRFLKVNQIEFDERMFDWGLSAVSRAPHWLGLGSSCWRPRLYAFARFAG